VWVFSKMISKTEQHQTNEPRSKNTAVLRLSIGLLQGLVLFYLYRARTEASWPDAYPEVYAAVLVMSCFAPVLWISGLGLIPRRNLSIWIFIAAFIAAVIGYYGHWRTVGVSVSQARDGLLSFPSVQIWMFGVVGFFISHSLVVASNVDQRRIASYSSYFEYSWKLLIQVKFSGLFVGVLWLVLNMGASLFKLIGLDFLANVINEPWFAIPVSVFGFACAIHLTDVRPVIVRGIRSLLLVLLSWLLPLATVMIGGFILSLPFTGLEPLWATKNAASLMLIACACLVVFINTHFQDGLGREVINRWLSTFARLACFLLIPLTSIAAYALCLRVLEHGWTSDRIIAACCLTIAACYAVGYSFAAIRARDGLRFVSTVNIATAGVVLLIWLGLFSPALDPARISVASQLSRLTSGNVEARDFDFKYLRFEGQRFGLDALKAMAQQQNGTDAVLIRERSKESMALQDRWSPEGKLTATELMSNLTIWPQTREIPQSFVAQDWAKSNSPWLLPTCLRNRAIKCDLFLVDLTSDKKNEIILIERDRASSVAKVFEEQADGSWVLIGHFSEQIVLCSDLLEKLKEGQAQTEAPRWQALKIDRSVFELIPYPKSDRTCVLK
jgi:hypothetical protein